MSNTEGLNEFEGLVEVEGLSVIQIQRCPREVDILLLTLSPKSTHDALTTLIA